ALSVFQQLARRYPRHPFIQEDRIRWLETLIETTSSASLYERLNHAEDRLLQDLRQRLPNELTRGIGETYRLYNQFRRNFPRSTLFDPERFERIAFLNNIRAEIPLIQELIDNRLRPVPDMP